MWNQNNPSLKALIFVGLLLVGAVWPASGQMTVGSGATASANPLCDRCAGASLLPGCGNGACAEACGGGNPRCEGCCQTRSIFCHLDAGDLFEHTDCRIGSDLCNADCIIANSAGGSSGTGSVKVRSDLLGAHGNVVLRRIVIGHFKGAATDASRVLLEQPSGNLVTLRQSGDGAYGVRWSVSSVTPGVGTTQEGDLLVLKFNADGDGAARLSLCGGAAMEFAGAGALADQGSALFDGLAARFATSCSPQQQEVLGEFVETGLNHDRWTQGPAVVLGRLLMADPQIAARTENNIAGWSATGGAPNLLPAQDGGEVVREEVGSFDPVAMPPGDSLELAFGADYFQ